MLFDYGEFLKGIDREDGQLRNYVGAPETPTVELAHEKLPYMLHGTGDVFVSALCGELLRQEDPLRALQGAADFCDACIRATERRQPSHWYGLAFEDVLAARKEETI